MLKFEPGIISILMFWGMLEMGIAVVATCLPVLYRLHHYWPPRRLMARLRLNGHSQSEESSLHRRMHMSELRPTPWLETQARKYIPKISDDAGSQNSHVQEMNIWEHTMITQTSDIV